MELTGMINPLQRASVGPKAARPEPAPSFKPVVASEPQFGVSFNWSKNYRIQKFLKAARKNDVAEAQKQLSAGVPINSRDRAEMTGLMHGAEVGNENIVTFLLEKGADASPASKTGRTALHYSVFEHADKKAPPSVTLVEKLAAVSNLNQQDDDGNTALVLAARNGYPEAVNVLIEKGSAIKTPNKQGMTSLMYAAWNGDAELVEKIARAVPVEERREFINLQNKYKHSAIDFAVNWKRKDIASLLIRLGAQVPKEVEEWATKPGDDPWGSDFDIVAEYLKDTRKASHEEPNGPV